MRVSVCLSICVCLSVCLSVCVVLLQVISQKNYGRMCTIVGTRVCLAQIYLLRYCQTISTKRTFSVEVVSMTTARRVGANVCIEDMHCALETGLPVPTVNMFWQESH